MEKIIMAAILVKVETIVQGLARNQVILAM